MASVSSRSSRWFGQRVGGRPRIAAGRIWLVGLGLLAAACSTGGGDEDEPNKDGASAGEQAAGQAGASDSASQDSSQDEDKDEDKDEDSEPSGSADNDMQGTGPAAGQDKAPEMTAPPALEYAPCDRAARVGWFAMVSRPADAIRTVATTEITGYVRDGVRPADADRVLMEEGACKLVTGPDLLCDPRCGSDEVCSPDGTCAPAPSAQPLGAVKLEGTTNPLTLEPSSANTYLISAGTEVDYLPYEPAADLRLVVAGDVVPGFTLRGKGVEELLLAEPELVVQEATPLALHWQAPLQPADSVRVHIELDIAHHGGVDAQVVCEAVDSGEFVVPAALIDGLLERGIAGFPAVTMVRRSVDSATLDVGCVEFVVASEVNRDVTIPGLTSCNSDEECPEDQICDASKLTCQ